MGSSRSRTTAAPARPGIGHDADVGLAGEHGSTNLVRVQALELDAGLRVERHELLHRPTHVVQATE